jgi:hypothetical protein
MATPRDYMLADLAHLFAEEGGTAVDVVIDGAPHRAVPHPEECVAGEVDGQLIYRRRLLFLDGDLAARLGQEMSLENRQWRVVSLATPSGLVDITLERTAA